MQQRGARWHKCKAQVLGSASVCLLLNTGQLIPKFGKVGPAESRLQLAKACGIIRVPGAAGTV